MGKKTMGEDTQIALMAKDIDYIRKSIDDLRKSMSEDYAKKSQVETLQTDFKNFKEGDYKYVRALVFGFVSLILLAFIGVVIAFFIPHR